MRSQLPIVHGPGPLVARVVQTAIGLVFLDAWLSLAAQVHVLIGSRGLLPVARTIARLRADPAARFVDVPTLFWLDASDAAITGGVAVGVVLAVLIVAGVLPRLLLLASALLYLAYAIACDVFTSFQWDSMLVEAGVLAALLPRDRPAPLPHLLLRLLLVKLYVLSGVAKWQSHLGDWLDGSAMTLYYETAPLPTPLAWWAHHLPAGWHHLESWSALALELGVPWLALGPRRARLAALALLTGFQAVNLATANYGFFVWLTLALHLALLDDADVARAVPRLGRRVASDAARAPRPGATIGRRIEGVAVAGYAAVWITASVAVALVRFVPDPPFAGAARAVVDAVGPWRLANPYHLFGHITRDRLEPQFETRTGADADWTEQDLRFKPGDPYRAPPFVAPHQPRVDFQLWFYGLGFRGPLPAYVAAILTKLCRDPDAVQPLFAAPLPPAPEAVRIAIWRYTFTSPDEARATGAWWHRELVGTSRALPCEQVADDP